MDDIEENYSEELPEAATSRDMIDEKMLDKDDSPLMDSEKGDATWGKNLLSTPTRKCGDTNGVRNPDGSMMIWC